MVVCDESSGFAVAGVSCHPSSPDIQQSLAVEEVFSVANRDLLSLRSSLVITMMPLEIRTRPSGC